jgi:hypothetical protein
MIDDFRHFQAGPDPSGKIWDVELEWLQTAVAIRHSDSVDVKFLLSDGGAKIEKVVALSHPALLHLAEAAGRRVTDPWCTRLAALHIERMILSGEDMDKTLVAPAPQELEEYSRAIAQARELLR